MTLKLAFVVQRYGTDIAGGAEQHCRQIVEHCTDDFDIEVLTTTARDYKAWVGAGDYAPGDEKIGGVTVRRFPVERRRRLWSFVWRTRMIHRLPHSLRQELKWIEAQGPYAPQLVRFVGEHRGDYDAFAFYCYRYYPTFFGARAAGDKAVLVPTAERDWAIHMPVYRELFDRTRGFIFLTEEERALVRSVANTQTTISTVVGLGVEMPPGPGEPGRFSRKYLGGARFLLYLGRIDANKGCPGMFDYALRYYKERPGCNTPLVLAGAQAMETPRHKRIHSLGFLSEEEKFDALYDCDLLIMPSPHEGLSVATLEAMAMGRPVVANAKGETPAGHCRRSGGGIAYRNYGEFAKALDDLTADADKRAQLGAAGQRYVAENYTWPIVRRKVRDFFETFVGKKD